MLERIYLDQNTIDSFNALSPDPKGQCSKCEKEFDTDEFIDMKKLKNNCPDCGNDQFYMFKEFSK